MYKENFGKKMNYRALLVENSVTLHRTCHIALTAGTSNSFDEMILTEHTGSSAALWFSLARLGCLTILHRFNNIVISQLCSRRYPISEIEVARSGLEPGPLDLQALHNRCSRIFFGNNFRITSLKTNRHTWLQCSYWFAFYMYQYLTMSCFVTIDSISILIIWSYQYHS